MPAVRWREALLLIGAAVALRAWDWGNPVIHVDEQWYLLVGDRMRHGAVPYLDIWDRKPIGLFLLFAAMRSLPGNGILAYQLCATACAAATAILVRRMAGRIGAGPAGAMTAGLLYLVALELLGGRGGQSPVFYNLYVAGAAALTLGLPALAADGRRGAIVGRGMAACLLAGLAIQTKYTPAFEGAFVGLAHAWALRRAGARWPAVAAAMLGWAIAGLAPTLAALGWYRAIGPGALHAWWFANFTSIGLRPGYPAAVLAGRLAGIAAFLSPLILAAAASWRRRAGAEQALAFAWLAAAVVGFIAIGTFFDHYSLPLVAPLAVAAAPAFDRHRWARMAAVTLALATYTVQRLRWPDDRASERTTAAIVRANDGGGCPYIFMGDTITYLLADACLPTAYAFPNLLAYDVEQGATGVDEAGEVRRILATRPPVIVDTDRRLPIWNRASVAALTPVLKRDYRLAAVVRRDVWHTLIWLRRDRRYRRP